MSDEPMVSDRDILVAIFNAVGTLAERLTGERMTVRIPKTGGGDLDVFASPSSVIFGLTKVAPSSLDAPLTLQASNRRRI